MMENYTVIRCGRCNKEIKRLTEGLIVYPGNPAYCADCNKEVQELPS
jgi:DNA-directed RNA polymerase subunit RPC12/RpoP